MLLIDKAASTLTQPPLRFAVRLPTYDATRKGRPMDFLSVYIVPIAVGAVALVLLAGLLNMTRGGSASTSQTLMRWRVGLQFLAIVVIMTAVYFAKK